MPQDSDPASERALCRQLAPLARGIAVLAITHREALLDIAGRVYRLEGGRITEAAPAPSLARPA